MKKLLLVLILLVAPVTVFAANPKVLTVTADGGKSKINITGTTEDGVYAVTCYLNDESGNEIAMDSVSVENKAFTDSFTAVKGKYTVKCANYAGESEFVTANVEVTEEVQQKGNQPATGDNIVLFIILGVVALAGIAFTTVKLVKKSK